MMHKNLVLSFLWISLLASTATLADEIAPSNPILTLSNSDKYYALELGGELIALFTAGQNNKVNRAMAKSPNYSAVKQILRATLDGEILRATEAVDSTHEIRWMDGGLNKPSRILLVDTTQSVPEQEIYSNFQREIGIANTIVNVKVSPGSNYVFIATTQYGSTDQAEGTILDLHTRSIIDILSLRDQESIMWSSPSSLLFKKLDDDGSSHLVNYDIEKDTDTSLEKTWVMASDKKLILLLSDEQGLELLDSTNGSISKLKMSYNSGDSYEILGADADNLYLFIKHYSVPEEIWQIPRNSDKGEAHKLFTRKGILSIDKAFYEDNYFFIQYRAGADRVLSIYSQDGTSLKDIPVPNCCSITKLAWAEREKSLRVSFTSALYRAQTLTYDLQSESWNQNPDAVMLTRDGIEYVSEVLFSRSLVDNKRIPTRLIHRKDLTQDSTHPVLIQSYGGFSTKGEIDSSYDPAAIDFLKRGGILAGPALRGGNEYGFNWHLQSMGENKIKTYQDLASVAEQLVAEKWTIPKLIISQGTSNGGLTVAATALLYPQDFGLVIPVAGVNDLLAKDRLDTQNEGWSYEYGSVSDAYNFFKTISPVELAAQAGNLKFFIVAGTEDTRVNPAHSYKLAKALEDLGPHPENIFLLTEMDAGHWLESVRYQNSIALDVEAKIWTMIYDQAGWTIK